jgi:hypothetical protein
VSISKKHPDSEIKALCSVQEVWWKKINFKNFPKELHLNKVFEFHQRMADLGSQGIGGENQY